MSKSYLDYVCDEGQTVNPLFNTLGITVACLSAGDVELRMSTGPGVAQGGGMVAGGILATMADEAMAHAVLSQLPPGRKTVTSEMNIRYLRGMMPGEDAVITAKAGIVRMGRHICVTEAKVLDREGRLLAVAGASFFILDDTV